MSNRSLNKVMLIGNLTRDPVLKYTPKNTAVCNLSLATNRSWTTSDGGERREEVDFHSVVVWSRLAEVCGEHLHKGDKVYIEGRLQTRKWQDKEGKDRYTTEVVTESMIMLSPKSGYAGGESGGENDGGYSAGLAGTGPSDDGSSSSSAPRKPRKARSSSQGSGDNSAANASSDPVSDQVTDVQDIADDIPF